MDLYATRGLIQTLRAASHDTVVPVRIVRDTERTGATGLRPLVDASAPNTAPRSDVVVRFSPRALQLGRSRADDTASTEPQTPREPPPRGRHLDVRA